MTGQQVGQLYRDVVRITEPYLGPAAERFIARQVSGHLHKSAEELTKDDLASLIEWARVTLSFLTADHDVVDEYVHRLEELAN